MIRRSPHSPAPRTCSPADGPWSLTDLIRSDLDPRWLPPGRSPDCSGCANVGAAPGRPRTRIWTPQPVEVSVAATVRIQVGMGEGQPCPFIALASIVDALVTATDPDHESHPTLITPPWRAKCRH